jgi:hypothetical protein
MPGRRAARAYAVISGFAEEEARAGPDGSAQGMPIRFFARRRAVTKGGNWRPGLDLNQA